MGGTGKQTDSGGMNGEWVKETWERKDWKLRTGMGEAGKETRSGGTNGGMGEEDRG